MKKAYLITEGAYHQDGYPRVIALKKKNAVKKCKDDGYKTIHGVICNDEERRWRHIDKIDVIDGDEKR